MGTGIAMIIYDWEKSVIETARTWPTSGPIYEFFNFWSDYHESRWIVLAVIIFIAVKFGWKKTSVPLVGATITILIADFLSRRVVKILIIRPRPNYIEHICYTSKCLGFVSSHSSNVSAAATFLCLYDKRNIYWAVPCVLFVSFSRIYLLDHFPLDVVGGIVLGTFSGASVWWIYKKLANRKFKNFEDLSK